MLGQAERIRALGPRAVLIKGGHAEGAESVDVLLDGEGFARFASPRLATRNTHGTGCTLSSAIAAGLAKGLSLREAIASARPTSAPPSRASDTLRIGHGHGPVHHFHGLWTA